MNVVIPRTKRHTNANLLETAVEVAHYYGFVSALSVLHPPSLRGAPGKNSALRGQGAPSFHERLPPLSAASGISALPYYLTLGNPPSSEKNSPTVPAPSKENPLKQTAGPTMIYYWQFSKRPRGEGNREGYFRLEIFGIKSGIAEGLLIRTAYAILTETGHGDITVELNTVGDRDSFARFTKECVAYYRKYTDILHAPCRNLLKQNSARLLACTYGKCEDLKRAAPKPIAFLSEENRRHFKEVLEYLEAMSIPYTINETLLGKNDCASKTIFELLRVGSSEANQSRIKAPRSLLAYGERYDDLARKSIRRDIPAIGISLPFTQTTALPLRDHVSFRKPYVYFIHLGTEARFKSFTVLELLRQARIPVCQALGTETLTERLSAAEERSIPYTIIMGHKEALQGTVIVRKTNIRSQETVLLGDLANYLKRTKQRV